MAITQKIKIDKIGQLIFHSFKHIPHLSCKFEHFVKKMWNIYFYILNIFGEKKNRGWIFFRVGEQLSEKVSINDVFFNNLFSVMHAWV